MSLIREWSGAFQIKGAPPTILEGFEFEIELKPGFRGHVAKMPKRSPITAEKEARKVAAALKMGYIARPESFEGPFLTKAQMVWKKDDPEGQMGDGFSIAERGHAEAI